MPRLPPSVNPEAFPNAMKRLSDLELRLSLMDESDITMQVLAPAMPFSKDKKEAIL